MDKELMEGILSLEEIINGVVPPILAEHLMPSFFGLHWGTAFAVAAESLKESVVYQQPDAYLIVNRLIAGTQFEFDLYFREEGLFRINADLYVSDSLWEIEDEEERLRTRLDDKLRNYYLWLAEHYAKMLGTAAFSGDRKSPGFPDNGLATFLTLWTLREGEFQVEYEHSEKELPIIVKLSSRALRNV